MEPVRSALYLDFDNVFSALAKLDPKIGMSFAEQPRAWLRRLAQGGQVDSPRRWLVLRCYMNPAGWIPHPDNGGGRLYFSKFRPPFTDAGFEVVDCPRLSHTKNGADIRYIQAMLGHAELSTTQIYAQVSIRALQAVHGATHPAATTPIPLSRLRENDDGDGEPERFVSSLRASPRELLAAALDQEIGEENRAHPGSGSIHPS